MHQCPGNLVAIGHAVVNYARAAHAFSAGIKCPYCIVRPAARLLLSCLVHSFQVVYTLYELNCQINAGTR